MFTSVSTGASEGRGGGVKYPPLPIPRPLPRVVAPLPLVLSEPLRNIEWTGPDWIAMDVRGGKIGREAACLYGAQLCAMSQNNVFEDQKILFFSRICFLVIST
jgi:hypothetical protein